MKKNLINSLFAAMGEDDAINEYIEVLIRGIENEKISEERFQELAQKFGIKVNDVSIKCAMSKIRNNYIISVYKDFEAFLSDFERYLSDYGSNLEPKMDGESKLKRLYKSILNISRVNSQEYLLLLICDYYRLLRNCIAHTESLNNLKVAYDKIQLRSKELRSMFPKLNAPNRMGSIQFDDFVLYSRAVKLLAEYLWENIEYDDEKIVAAIDIKKYMKFKNNYRRFYAAVKNEVQECFTINDEKASALTEKVLTKIV